MDSIHLLVVWREVHHRVADKVLRDARGHFDLGVADDVVVDIVVCDYQLLPVLLAVDFVNIDVICVAALVKLCIFFNLLFAPSHRSIILVSLFSYNLWILFVFGSRAIFS